MEDGGVISSGAKGQRAPVHYSINKVYYIRGVLLRRVLVEA